MGQFDQTPMFAGELAFLSNFDQTPFRMPLLDVEVASAEHAFNALKTVDPGQQRYVLEAPTPGESKRRGDGSHFGAAGTLAGGSGQCSRCSRRSSPSPLSRRCWLTPAI